MRRIRRYNSAVIVAAILIATAILGLPTIWDWLQARPAADLDSNGATLRNAALAIAAAVALPLALWRGLVADRQAGAARRQAETAQHGLLNERYQKGADMLGSAVLSVRLGGIYALRSLAEEHPQQYGVQILRLFCAFARHPTEDSTLGSRMPSGAQGNTSENVPPIEARADTQAVMKAIGAHDKLGLVLEAELLDLHGADLRAVLLKGANLSGAVLIDADLSSALLAFANLSGAYLYDANLSGAQLEGAEGLTQLQLDHARADPSCPPDWTCHTWDAETGEPLVWRGKPLKRED